MEQKNKNKKTLEQGEWPSALGLIVSIISSIVVTVITVLVATR